MLLRARAHTTHTHKPHAPSPSPKKTTNNKNKKRPGKKCLVLDIDYTLFDLGSSAERPDELARPHLHSFLAACYEHYDILIWSATSMKVGLFFVVCVWGGACVWVRQHQKHNNNPSASTH